MARHLTGKEAANEKRWQHAILSNLDPKTGLLVRPKTSFSEPVADLGDQALTLYALATAYADQPDPALEARHRQDGGSSAQPLRGRATG